MSFSPENVGNWSSSPRDDLRFLQDLFIAVSRFSRGPVAGNDRRQHFFGPTGSNTTTISDRIGKKTIGDCNPVGSKKDSENTFNWAPGEAGKNSSE